MIILSFILFSESETPKLSIIAKQKYNFTSIFYFKFIFYYFLFINFFIKFEIINILKDNNSHIS